MASALLLEKASINFLKSLFNGGEAKSGYENANFYFNKKLQIFNLLTADTLK